MCIAQTFGGAYTAIPFVQQNAVVAGQWLSQAVFLDGIAIAQLIPAPLVMFTTFVGFMGAGVPGALLMTLGVFLPAFSFTLIGHNLFERVVHIRALSSFLDGVTAGVMGLVAVTALQLLRAAVLGPLEAAVFVLTLAVLYTFTHPATGIILVVGAGIAAQVLFT